MVDKIKLESFNENIVITLKLRTRGVLFRTKKLLI